MQRSEDLGLLVADEEDHETLLLHRISADDIYRKQEGILQLHSFVSFLPVYKFCYVSVQFHDKTYSSIQIQLYLGRIRSIQLNWLLAFKRRLVAPIYGKFFDN